MANHRSGGQAAPSTCRRPAQPTCRASIGCRRRPPPTPTHRLGEDDRVQRHLGLAMSVLPVDLGWSQVGHCLSYQPFVGPAATRDLTFKVVHVAKELVSTRDRRRPSRNVDRGREVADCFRPELTLRASLQHLLGVERPPPSPSSTTSHHTFRTVSRRTRASSKTREANHARS
jgi:hypothetical protein